MCQSIAWAIVGIHACGATLPVVPASLNELQLTLAILDPAQVRVAAGTVDERTEVQVLAMPLGDPVSLRIRLQNGGAEATVPTVPLGTRYTATVVHVVHPDGSSHVLEHISRKGVVRGRPPVKPISPGDVQILDAFLFEEVSKDEEGRYLYSYAFPTEGQYEIYVEYLVGDFAEHWRFRRGEIAQEPTRLESNRVVVTVGAPFAGWQDLKDAKIQEYIGRAEWPALADSTSSIHSAVVAANRPWLNEWRDVLLAEQSVE